METAHKLIVTGLVVGFLGFGLPFIGNTIQASTAEGFTGSAVVDKHYINGSFCKIEITQENGNQQEMVYGPKMTCYDVKDGMSINLVNGLIK